MKKQQTRKLIARKKPKQLPPPGMHPGRCVQIIDFGTQRSLFNDADKWHPVRFTFELPLEKAVFDPEKGPQPFVVSREYNLTLGKNSALRKTVELWLSRKLTEGEAVAGLDLSQFLGKPAMLNVIQEQNNQGEMTAEIIGITGLPREEKAPKQINPSVFYLIEDGRNEVFNSFPQWMQERICASEEIGGNRPSASEIIERNVREATANRLAEPSSAEFDEEEMNREIAAMTANGEES